MPFKRGAKKPGRKVSPSPVRAVRIAERDPCQICGKGTSVERIFRVEEKTEKTKNIHLVFLDRHGWYCEHGAQCPAVADVKKHLRHSR